MADVELVIKISEKVYNALTHTEFDANLVTDEMRKSIANSTPLPKGHGRLGDLDILVKHNAISESYANLFTIIEADTESKLDGDPIDIDKAVEHYDGTLEMLKGIDLEDKI